MTFIEFARSHGVLIDPDRFMHGKIKRCGTVTHPRSLNGAYSFENGRGWVRLWDQGERTIWYQDPSAKPWSEEENAAWKRRQDLARQERVAEHARAARKASAMLISCTKATHNYFDFKGLGGTEGLILPEGQLFVPMRNVRNNELQGAQVIHWDSEGREYIKKMLYGMRASDAIFAMGPKGASETILCEGYATGLSIELACHLVRLSARVIVCFSANNLKRVALHFPRAIVYADNDRSGTGEAVALETGLRWCMSDTIGHDANDDHERFGLMTVSKKIMQAKLMPV